MNESKAEGLVGEFGPLDFKPRALLLTGFLPPAPLHLWWCREVRGGGGERRRLGREVEGE